VAEVREAEEVAGEVPALRQPRLVGLSALWLFHCRFECRRMRLKFFAQFVKMLPTTQCRQRIRRVACLCMCAQLFSGMLLWVPSCAVLDCTYFQGQWPTVKICFFSCWSRDAIFLNAYCIWKDLSFNKEVRTFFPKCIIRGQTSLSREQ
jgi:hypothetical protein